MRLTPKFEGLWRDHDFMQLWSAQAISQFGTQVSLLAIPLTAALTLDASARQMGVLVAAETAPFLLFGLFAGVIADRVRRRQLLIWTDVGRALLFATIPLAWLLDALTLWQLLVVAFAAGTLTVLFEVAYQSYLPSLVGREHLAEGNSKLVTSGAVAQIGGPGLAGLLIQLATAPVAVLLDALSFLGSAACLLRICKPEAAIDASLRRPMLAEIGEGLGYIGRHPLLRPIAACTATSNLFSSAFTAIFILFVTRELGLSAGWIGFIFGLGGAGFIVGALLAPRVAARIGVGPAIIASIAFGSLSQFVVPFVDGPRLAVTGILMLSFAWSTVAGAIYNITQVTLRQTITPDRLLGRMNATMRFIVWGVMPIGALLGGFLGDYHGLRETLLVTAVGGSLAVLWPLFSQVRGLRETPPAAADSAVADAPA